MPAWLIAGPGHGLALALAQAMNFLIKIRIKKHNLLKGGPSCAKREEIFFVLFLIFLFTSSHLLFSNTNTNTNINTNINNTNINTNNINTNININRQTAKTDRQPASHTASQV